MVYGVQAFSALDTALGGMRDASAWVESAAQEVALSGLEGFAADSVDLSGQALRTLESVEASALQDGLIDLGVAASIYTANASVVETLVGLDKALLAIA